MAWPKGKPRPIGAGRAKGTHNKSRETLLEICARHNVIPFEALLMIYKEAVEPNVALGAIKEACKYIYPQLKAIEHSGEIANPYVNLTEEELEKLVKERLKK